MSDFHQYIASDLQMSVERLTEERDALLAELAVKRLEALRWRVAATYGGMPDLFSMHLDMVDLLRRAEAAEAALKRLDT